jgi:hypothetical protein
VSDLPIAAISIVRITTASRNQGVGPEASLNLTPMNDISTMPNE